MRDSPAGSFAVFSISSGCKLLDGFGVRGAWDRLLLQKIPYELYVNIQSILEKEWISMPDS
jgi:hypothetical protein